MLISVVPVKVCRSLYLEKRTKKTETSHTLEEDSLVCRTVSSTHTSVNTSDSFEATGCVGYYGGKRVFDVGGQRSERRKWIHCFDNVESIIFITAISEYDQVLFEDETTNRMIESMQLFNSICNSTWFLSTAMILFMNKKDLFMEKIQRVNITTAFPDYEGGQNYEEAVAFIKMKFAELNLNPDKKTIYMHETCATDTNQVQLVISSVIDTIIQKNLQKAGMM
uniref:Uncharacterized protein n=1 Tax=Caenorhabditis japonica TaxID=281687 RepID=A0A8R1HQF3_CAEJA